MMKERISKWVERYDENGYLHGSLLVAKSGKVIVSKGFGMANWEHMVPNKPTTKFRIGSLTKAFTSLAIFQLHEKGFLNIDDCIAKYLNDYPRGENITIYHCLTNTSGIPNYTSFPDFWSTTMRLPMTLEQLIDSFKNHKLEFEPGSEFDYSNSGYAVLTAIIEKVSGVSYAKYIKDYICIPLGMVNTGCDDGVQVIANLASGYSYWKNPIHAAYADLSFPLGAYGLYSTTEDLFLWDQALKSLSLLNEENTKKLFKAYRDSYACGWMVSEVCERKCVHHYGDISGYFSDFLRFVDEDITIIYLSNMNVTPVTHLTREIAKIIFGEDVQLPPTAKPIEITNQENLIGKFLTKEGTDQIEITLEQNEMYITVPKMYGVLYKFKLVPIYHNALKTTFLTEMVYEQVEMNYSTSGKVEQLFYKDCHNNQFAAWRHYE
ncbi:MAG TPA: serine hydrolase domain-containing protein [Ureibacillus sp.]|nr:serine hydrolase domain-containing protein [Ureibacillus sp.]